MRMTHTLFAIAAPLLFASLAPAAELSPVTLRAAAQRGLALLEKTSPTFIKKGGCNSCHNQMLPAAAQAFARRRGIPTGETIAQLSPDYVRELAAHHVGGRLKVAPEHTDPGVLEVMKKPAIDNFGTFDRVTWACDARDLLVEPDLRGRGGDADAWNSNGINFAFELNNGAIAGPAVPTPSAIGGGLPGRAVNQLEKHQALCPVGGLATAQLAAQFPSPLGDHFGAQSLNECVVGCVCSQGLLRHLNAAVCTAARTKAIGSRTGPVFPLSGSQAAWAAGRGSRSRRASTVRASHMSVRAT